MSIAKRKIDWPAANTLDRLLGSLAQWLGAEVKPRAQSQVYALEDYLALEKTKHAVLDIQLPAEFAFEESLDVRTGNSNDARRIAEHEASHLDPLADGRSLVLGGAFDAKSKNIPLLFAQADTLTSIERKAGKLGVHELRLVTDAPSPVSFTSPGTRRTQRKGRRLWAVAYLLLAASLWAVPNAYLYRQSTQLADLSAQEANLRSQLAVRRAAEREVSALQTLAERGVGHHTLAGRLDTLARATVAAPDGTRWLSVEMEKGRLEITGIGPSAADAREALASAFPDTRIAFSQSIASEEGGLQSFVVEVEPAK